MRGYEYYSFNDEDRPYLDINDLGREGWELVSTTDTREKRWDYDYDEPYWRIITTYHFKREIDIEPPQKREASKEKTPDYTAAGALKRAEKAERKSLKASKKSFWGTRGFLPPVPDPWEE